MPPKLANIKPREVVRALQKGGFQIHETTGSHVHLKHPVRPGRVTVPYHERFDLPKHIVKRSLAKKDSPTRSLLSS